MTLMICGHPRSGTTLLRNLCLYHPQLTVTNEFGAFNYLGASRREYSRYMLQRWWKKGIGGHRTLLTAHTKSRRSRIVWSLMNRHIFTIHYLLRLWLARRRTVDAALVNDLYRTIFPDSLHAGDKFPEYIFGLDQYTALDELFIIVIYRDCRDVTSSALKRAKSDWKYNSPGTYSKMKTAEQIATRWVQSITLMEKHRKRLHIVRYEELVQRPRETLSALGDFLGVSVADFRFDMVRDDRIGNYRSGLSAEELAIVLRIAGPAMRQMGYA